MGVTVNEDLLTEDGQPGALPVGVYELESDIPADRQKLFEVNGKIYTAPKKIKHRVVFRYLRSVHRDDGEEAVARLMYDVLGEAVIDAMADEDLSDEEEDLVMKVVRKHTMGAMERSLGNSSNGRRR